MEYESTATTWLPAPIANRSSVPVAEIDTIRRGRLGILTAAFCARTTTG
jgi:hypothetical protein